LSEGQWSNPDCETFTDALKDFREASLARRHRVYVRRGMMHDQLGHSGV